MLGFTLPAVRGVTLSSCADNAGTLAAARSVAITHDDFALADSNHDGKLSGREADRYLGFAVSTSSDIDADGRLTEQEWIKNEPAQLAIFQRCDTNKDGAVSLSEAITYSRDGRTSVALMRQADRNRDGKLTRAEIDAYFMRVTGLGA
jgi:Ca2+-binding EF-hand superfamily protein